MNMETLPVNAIIVDDRQRSDLGDLTNMVESIRAHGIIQPLIVDQTNKLICGERRFRAATIAGLTHVPVCRREVLTDAEFAELELIENTHRKDLDWREKCKAIAKVHELRRRNAVLASQPWGLRETGELLEVGLSDVSYALRVAECLNAGDKEVAACANMFNACQLLLQRKAQEVESNIMSARLATIVNDAEQQVAGFTKDAAPPVPRGDAPPLPGFALPAWSSQAKLVHGDGLVWLRSQPAESVDHIYTDPPYGIEMDNIQQDGIGMNVELVKDTHDVEQNIGLLKQFIPLAADVLKPTGWLVFWCDQDNWAWLRDLAGDCGFRVQRWPLIWVKPYPCQNGQAYKNFTKSTEIAMVCAMPDATLNQTRPSNYIIVDNDKKNYCVTNPFWKPCKLHWWIIEAISVLGSTIVDPFAGCGSIPLSCLQAKRNTIAIEVDQTHYLQMEKIILS